VDANKSQNRSDPYSIAYAEAWMDEWMEGRMGNSAVAGTYDYAVAV